MSPKERESIPYYRAARFAAAAPAGQAYFSIQATLLADPGNDLSVFRLQIDRVSHVVVLGQPPRQDLAHQLRTILAAGEPVRLPRDVLRLLYQRRVEAMKEGRWVERHFRPGKRL